MAPRPRKRDSRDLPPPQEADTELTPTRAWQALVPDLHALTPTDELNKTEAALRRAEDTAERLLLLVHYSIDWENSWITDPKYLKNYWDKILPGRVFRASRRSVTLDEWWSSPALTRLGLQAPRYPDRRRELAELLREPPKPVLRAFQRSLPALLLRVRIIKEAVDADRKSKHA
ncbi:hypothetical protein [Mycobacterium servetii]|uniref:Uncharacterized protein n=1 Tax=Mycobacterium servetii TaxID=3237418 RepID=A0ABV4CCE6_9MYCO